MRYNKCNFEIVSTILSYYKSIGNNKIIIIVRYYNAFIKCLVFLINII